MNGERLGYREQALLSEFLSLPATTLPAVTFADENDSWAHDAWVVARECLEHNSTPVSRCGTHIVLWAARGEWREGIVI